MRRILLIFAAFCLLVVLAHAGMVEAQQLLGVPLGVGKWFPVSYGYPRTPSYLQVGIALLTVIGFAGALRLLPPHI